MYDVCVTIVSTSLIRIIMYRTNEDYEMDRPDVVYVILRPHRLLTERYKNADVVISAESEEAVKVYNECKRARNFITIPIL